jgi:hypothetical protein
MNPTPSSALLESLNRLHAAFPKWRFGQLVANLMTAAGCQETDAIWDVEDAQLLAASERLTFGNCERQTVQA